VVRKQNCDSACFKTGGGPEVVRRQNCENIVSVLKGVLQSPSTDKQTDGRTEEPDRTGPERPLLAQSSPSLQFRLIFEHRAPWHNCLQEQSLLMLAVLLKMMRSLTMHMHT